jgi:stringent starvation protein B
VTEAPSTRPYLIRALHQWCEDHGFTPYLVVSVNGSVQVPKQYVSPQGEVVLNVSYGATNGLRLGNDFIEFQARFGGVPQAVSVPVGRVTAIYAKENGQGMAFPAEDMSESSSQGAPISEGGGEPPRGKPTLTRIK